MAWSDIFLPKGAMTAAEQEANYAAQKAKLAKQIERQEQMRREQDTLVLYALPGGNPAIWSDGFSDRQQAAYNMHLEDQNAAALAGFREGLADGINNVRTFIGSAINNTAGTVFRLFPWQVWLGLAVAGFLYFGGLAWLKKQIKFA